MRPTRSFPICARCLRLDHACSTWGSDGRNLPAIAAAGMRVVGADLSREGLVRARHRTRAPLVRADVEALPFVSDCFDGVVTWLVLCGLAPDSARHGFGEARRILDADGSLLVAGCAGRLRACGLDPGVPAPAGFEVLARERLEGSFGSSETRWVYELRRIDEAQSPVAVA